MLQTFNITITVKGPVLTRATAAGAFGIDSPIARDHRDRPYLPGTHVLGKARHALHHLLNAQQRASPAHAPIPRDALVWFGQLSSGDYGDQQKGLGARRRIFCSDLVEATTASVLGVATRTRTRIKKDDDFGAVEDGMLQVLEAPYAVGETVTFSGEIDFIGRADEIEAMRRAFEIALRWTTQFGGLRTIGFGRAERVSMAAQTDRQSVPVRRGTPERFALALKFRDPLTIGERRNNSNIYNTSDVVPGGAIKGALANLIRAGEGLAGGEALKDSKSYPNLARHFSVLRITHLFPSPKLVPHRPAVWPKSLVAVGKKVLKDVALTSGSGTIDDMAPAFHVDWKNEFGVANALVGWPKVPKTLIVRTSVEIDALSAKTGALYAQEHCEIDDHVWIGSVDLSQVPEYARASVADEFWNAISNGLPGVGRSQSNAQLVDVVEGQREGAPWRMNPDGQIVLSLQTPALLRGPETGYAAAFTEMSKNTLRYIRHFATERISGAEFMANRYFDGRQYLPWLLTDAGGVFVLEPVGDVAKASDCIKRWLKHGLPIAKSLKDFYGLDMNATDAALWDKCPYIAQNGYGEIAADMELHRRADLRAVLDA